jgi:biopolymer transport protein ExbD
MTMRKKRHMPEAHGEHPNVVPLIDVMLCIIVFYMLAAKIGVSSGADESIKLPETNFGKELRDVGSTNTLIVNVTERLNEPFITAVVEGGSSLQELSVKTDDKTRRSLETELKKLRFGADGKPNTADDNPDLKVIVRGDGEELTYRAFFPVMVAITNAGVSNVFHNTKKASN